MLATTKEADFGDTPVYFDSHGIANVQSLYCLSKKIRVTYNNSDHDGVFQVHTTKRNVEFKPPPKGLHALNLKENPVVIFLLANHAELVLPNPGSTPDHHVHVNTVRNNYEGFSRNQIERATNCMPTHGHGGHSPCL